MGQAGNPGLSDDECRQAAEVYTATGRNQTQAAEQIGISRAAFQNRLKAAARRGFLGTDHVLPGYQISKTTTTPNGGQFVQQKPEPGERFEVPEGQAIKGVSAYVDADGNVLAKWIKTREGELGPDALADLIRQAFEDWRPPVFPTIVVPETEGDFLTVYPIADMHLGLKAVADESGADFDLAIATERFRKTTERLFSLSPNSGTALILQLGDFTHVDDDLALTPRGKHTLQVSDRLIDIVKAGVGIMIDYVYLALNKHEHVIVKCLKGNHDLNVWVALYVALDQHFRGNPRVTVDGGTADYWFFRWGANLIGAHHGHRLKPEEMAGAMATECAEDWGQTLYRWFLHGHFHTDRAREILGVRVECVRTIADSDHHHSGKYGSGKSLISVTIHKDTGEDGRARVNLPPVRRRAVQVA